MGRETFYCSFSPLLLCCISTIYNEETKENIYRLCCFLVNVVRCCWSSKTLYILVWVSATTSDWGVEITILFPSGYLIYDISRLQKNRFCREIFLNSNITLAKNKQENVVTQALTGIYLPSCKAKKLYPRKSELKPVYSTDGGSTARRALI